MRYLILPKIFLLLLVELMFAGYLGSLPVFGLSDRSKRLIEWPSLKFSKDNSEDWRSRGWVFERNGFLEILIE